MNKDNAIQQFLNYIESTQNGHYAQGNGLQTKDYIEALGLAEDAYIFSIIKYVSRFPKTKNHKDLLKAAHYSIMLLDYLNKKEGKDEQKD